MGNPYLHKNRKPRNSAPSKTLVSNNRVIKNIIEVLPVVAPAAAAQES